MYQVEVPLVPGLSSLGVPGVPRHTQILADELTLFQPSWIDYAHLGNYYWHTQMSRPSDGPVVRLKVRYKFIYCEFRFSNDEHTVH